MTKRTTPALQLSRPANVQAYQPDDTLISAWNPDLRAADTDGSNVITILDQIGEDWYGEGVTAKRVSAALRSIQSDTIIVDINSPGGDFFEGVAIYNLLRQDPRHVMVRILSLAASAASVIAMAADTVQIGRAGFLMIHNAWVVAVGNRHDMLEASKTMEPFDDAMAAVYAAKAGVDRAKAAAWMDAETWFNGEQAIEAGLADKLLSADVRESGDASGKTKSAVRRIDSLLAKQDIPRSERRALLAEVKGGTPSAAPSVTPRADDDWIAEMRSLTETLKR